MLLDTCIELWDRHKANPDVNKRPGCTPPGFCLLDVEEEVALIYWQVHNARDTCAENRDNGLIVPSTYPSVTRRPTVVTTDAITFRGRDLYFLTQRDSWPLLDKYEQEYMEEQMEKEMYLPSFNISRNKTEEWKPRYLTQSVFYGNFTFTYPTLYLAHRPVCAMNLLFYHY